MDKNLPGTTGRATCVAATEAAALQVLARHSGLRPLTLGGRNLLPVVQGGMGVGISAGGLAGTVAGLGGIGTISSVDLRRHHPDLMARTADVARKPDAKQRVDAANLEALAREIARARELAGGRGLLAVNVMRAVSEYDHYVRHALDCGIDAVVVGAGLPLDLPELARDHPDVALVPILSDARGVQLLVRKWEKKGRLPDAIVIEHPRLAGGHLGAAKVADLKDPPLRFRRRAAGGAGFPALGRPRGPHPADRRRRHFLPRGHPPAAGPRRVRGPARHRLRRDPGVRCPSRLQAGAGRRAAGGHRRVHQRGRAAGTRRAHALAGQVPAPGGKAARARRTSKHCNQWFDCLAHCGLRDGIAAWGQFCIDKYLGHALAGEVNQGLFFRGAGRVPFGDQIRSVQELMQWLLGGILPPGVQENDTDGWPATERAEAVVAAEQEE